MTAAAGGRLELRATSAAGATDGLGLRLAERRPEPGHFWIRYTPKGWQGPERPWLDLAAGRLGRSGRPAASPWLGAAPPEAPGTDPALLAAAPPPAAGADPAARAPAAPPPAAGTDLAARAPAAADAGRPGPSAAPPRLDRLAEPPLDDVLYLPPVPERLAGERDALAARALAAGTPVLVQLLPGDPTALPPAAGAVLVVDLLAALLAADLDALAMPPPGTAAAAWPLLPGITDLPELWERGCERLAAAGLERLQAMVPALGPGDRRRLAQGLDESAFAALFHRQPPAERELARVAHRHGLAPFLPRPLPRPPLPRAPNRRIAGLLALAAELWQRLGRPVEQAQALFRAARWLDATAYDVEALRREGNLAVVTALDPLARSLVAEAAGGGDPALLAELMAEYLD